MDSFQFGKDGTPSWTLPPGWSQKTVVENRTFDLVNAAGTRIEITSANVADVADEQPIKTRLNIWRDELGLEAFPEADWKDAFKTGVNKSNKSERTHYLFQFAQPPSATSLTIVGYIIPFPDPDPPR